MEMKNVGELNDNVQPLNYKLSFNTNLDTLVFSCEETITINIKMKIKDY